MDDLISRQAAIETLNFDAELLRRALDNTDFVGIERAKYEWGLGLIESFIYDMEELPPAQPEIIRCRDCVYGEQDDIGRWFCRSLGCQVGDEDGSGFCADGERRENDGTD